MFGSFKSEANITIEKPAFTLIELKNSFVIKFRYNTVIMNTIVT